LLSVNVVIVLRSKVAYETIGNETLGSSLTAEGMIIEF